MAASVKAKGKDQAETTVRPEYVGAHETAGAFARTLLTGDAGEAAAYFSAGAQFLTPDGTELSGRDSIVALLTQLIAPDQRLQIRAGRTITADSLALCTQYWSRSSRSARTERFEATNTARLVLAREGRRWQIVIAAPWG